MKRYSWLACALALVVATSSAGAQGRQGGGRGEGGRGEGGRGQQINWNARMPWGPLEAAVRALAAPFPLEQQTAEAFKVFDNVYYVGAQVVGAYLIVSGNEIALVDATYAETADSVLNNIRKVGFDPAKLKYIFITHQHADHFAGVGRVKQVATNARLGASEADWEGIEKQMVTPIGNQNPGIKYSRDLVIKDGDTFKVGNDTVKIYVTPGHTPGSLLLDVPVHQSGKTYRAMIPCTGINPSPDLTMPYIKSMERIKQLGPWDAILPPHAFLQPHDATLIGPADIIFNGQAPGAKRAQGNPALLGAAKISAYFDDILKVANQKLAAEQGRSTGN
jgi:glyoxylase-like metal-dependent hydrolase (beta-lactamase superfamily II)